MCFELRKKPNEDPSLIPISLFPQIENELKGHFKIVSDIQRVLKVVLNSIKENDFHGAFEAREKQLDCCIHSQGDYFEGGGR
jgi:hypothetical protein